MPVLTKFLVWVGSTTRSGSTVAKASKPTCSPRAREDVSGREVVECYCRSLECDRVSSLINQAVHIPAYEDRAKKGFRPPHRFEWRGGWVHTQGVMAFWRDGRKANRKHPEYGCHYYNVTSDCGQVFQLQYESTGSGLGRWVLYRVIRSVVR